jgi:hypothetical protein
MAPSSMEWTASEARVNVVAGLYSALVSRRHFNSITMISTPHLIRMKNCRRSRRDFAVFSGEVRRLLDPNSRPSCLFLVLPCCRQCPASSQAWRPSLSNFSAWRIPSSISRALGESTSKQRDFLCPRQDLKRLEVPCMNSDLSQ